MINERFFSKLFIFKACRCAEAPFQQPSHLWRCYLIQEKLINMGKKGFFQICKRRWIADLKKEEIWLSVWSISLYGFN